MKVAFTNNISRERIAHEINLMISEIDHMNQPVKPMALTKFENYTRKEVLESVF